MKHNESNRLTATIESLPLIGVLYHALFSNNQLNYESLIWDTSLLTPLQIGDNVCHSPPRSFRFVARALRRKYGYSWMDIRY
jgi:hypothetical protein